MLYSIYEDGVYAVAFSPSMKIDEKILEGVYCGMTCKDRKLIFLAVFIGLPILIVFNYFFYYMYEKNLEDKSLKMREEFVDNKLKEIENVNIDFKGQTVFEKYEEGV